MVTKNTIARYFAAFANSHWQIKDTDMGDISEFGQSRAYNYPVMYVMDQPGQINGKEDNHTYVVLFGDRVLNGRENEQEVLSDTHQYCRDLVAALDDQSTNDWELVEVSSYVPFTNRDKDDIAGHTVTVTIRSDFNYDLCAVPWDGMGGDSLPIIFQGDYYESFMQSKSFAISSPIIGDDLPSYFTKKQIKLAQVNEVLVGGTGTVTYNVYYAATKDDVSPLKVWTADRTISSYSGADTIVFDTRIIPKGMWVWIEVSAVTGTIDIMAITIFFNNKLQ